ncbi:MAG: hypothetical protein II161_06620 [Erysipelotrichaceae bacterium]|nr:hypothetical protein [Erysipelotrichaceae bacterium]
MKKLKDFFEHIIYVDDEETKEEKDEVIDAKVKPAQKSVKEVRKETPFVTIQDLSSETEKTGTDEPVTLMVQDPVKPKTLTPEPEKEKDPRVPTFINLNRPKREEPAVEEVQPEEETFIEEDKPEEIVKPESKEIKREDYIPSTVISPMFGVQNNEAKGKQKNVKKKPTVTPDLADLNFENSSVLGTVFSPLYGSPDEEGKQPDDKVDPKVAKMSVKDIIADRKQPAEKKPAARDTKPAEKKEDNPNIKPTLSVFGNPIETKKPETGKETKKSPFVNVGKKSSSKLSGIDVTPFGTGVLKKETEEQVNTRVSIHDAWKETVTATAKKEKPAEKTEDAVISDEQLYENMSLFDMEEE